MLRITSLLSLIFLFGCASHPIRDIAQTDEVKNPALSAPVDVVRDQWGIPHIYGQSPADVAFAQGYVMAQDRLIQMDLARHKAAGTLSELLGDLAPEVIDRDIQMRVHHLRATVEQAWAMLQASTDPKDQAITKMLTSFAAGVNAYIADLQDQKYSLPPSLALLYNPQTIKPWTEVDSLLLGQLQAFSLSFDADSDIFRTQLSVACKAAFDDATMSNLAARKGLGDDLQLLAPMDPTYTLPTVDGWTGMNGDTSTASLDPKLLPLLEQARMTVRGVGHDNQIAPSVGSNNWVIGPSLSASGHVMVANDTHLDLSNPPVFYLVHLVSTGAQKLDVMGVQFPGIPGVILGMNRHIAWGSTVNQIDVTDVYQETIAPCDDGSGPCALFNGQKVPLVPRVENIDVGRFGEIVRTVSVTLYDVPHHGPIIPRIDTTDHSVAPLGQTELSIRYTGHEPAPKLSTVVYGLDTANSVSEAVAAIDSGFLYGNQNWVIGDDQGHFGWTQFTRAPRRSPSAPPWKVLPGDGSAEWGGDLDPKYIPHAYDPAQGYIATANNDPIGVTDDNDPFFDEPVIDGAPLYLGADYDPGTRVGRITKRIQAATQSGGKLTLDDLQSIQADAVSEWAQALQPTFLAAAQALAEEIAQPGSHADLTPIVATADATAKPLVAQMIPLVQGWDGTMASGAAEDNPTPAQVSAAQAATIMGVWMRRFADRTFGDEFEKLGFSAGAFAQLKLLVRLVAHDPSLKTGIDPATGDSVLFDSLDNPQPQSLRYVAAQAILDALDFLVRYRATGPDPAAWRWGNLHTLTLSFLAPVDALQIPLKDDPAYPLGFPRQGDIGTVDAAGDSIDTGDFSYTHGPAIRFVAELDRRHGPRARNVIPGGEVLDPTSPHYRDQMELWRKNQTLDLAFSEDDVAASAKLELMQNGVGRVRFAPR